jgi:hypothetical protein
MHRTSVSLFVIVLVSAGLFGGSLGASASASCTAYAGCVDTRTRVLSPRVAQEGSRVAICGKVTVKGSNVHARGKLKFKVTRSGGYSSVKHADYAGGTVCTRTGRLMQGEYTVSVKYQPLRGSVFNSSRDASAFRVS